jgi:hypothetical protein
MGAKRLTWLFIPALAALAHLVLPATSSATYLYFNSDPGDYIGQGVTQTWTPVDGTFTASGSSNHTFAAVDFNGGDTNWTLDFAAPAGQQLIAGQQYTGAMRYPFQGSAPGMDISGSGRGSNTLTGIFTIQQVGYGSGGSLNQFTATFEQHSEGGVPALRGTVVFNAADAVASPSDIRAACHMTAQQFQNLAPYMSQLAKAPTGVFLTGQPGDYIVGNQTLTFLPSNASISVTGGIGGVHVSLNTPGFGHFWYLDFVPPSTLPLTAGDWGSATRYPFESPTKPGLDVSGDGRGSNTLTGDFEILEEAFDSSGNITSFDALFEQHSEGAVPAAFGRVRFNAPVPEPSSYVLAICGLLGAGLRFKWITSSISRS